MDLQRTSPGDQKFYYFYPTQGLVIPVEPVVKMEHPQFTPLLEADLECLTDWLNQPHLQQWWRKGAITREKVREKYLPRIKNQEDARPYLVSMNGKPAGFIQYYPVSRGRSDWWPDECGENVIGVDMFIGNEEMTGKGLGTLMLSEFIRYLSQRRVINEVRIDPHPENQRAIRCYEKVGFVRKGIIETPEGPAMMMTYSPGQTP